MNSRIHYHDYLKLDKLLSAQSLRSEETGKPAHDEMLFIIVHQAYEIWFKQILFEVNAVIQKMSSSYIKESELGFAVHTLDRVNEILKLLIQQIDVLETMTPLDFLEFRDLLYPASGFQSFQFKALEIKLGLNEKRRLVFNNTDYKDHFPEDLASKLAQLETEKTLFDTVNSWLERTPFLEIPEFSFWESYQKAVNSMFEKDRKLVTDHELHTEEDKIRNLNIIEASQKVFKQLFSEEKYQELRNKGEWNLSYKALHASLLIQLYREQPVFQTPYRLLTALVDMDEHLTQWRYRHMLMVKRMLGSKMGTGGSSGAKYLKESTENHQIFSDLTKLTSFFIPRSALPDLPKEAISRMGFAYES